MEIPEMVVTVMRNRGWNEGASLMQHWLDHPSNDDPALGVPDLSTVSVSWTLGFSRAASVYREAVSSKIWTSDDAKARIRRTIDRRYSSSSTEGILCVDTATGSDPQAFSAGNLARIYEDRVAYTPMDEMLVQVDSLTASLGRFGYYFNVGGRFARSNGSYEVHIDRVGVYIRDPFDFNGAQHLGFWDLCQSYVARAMPIHCWDVLHRAYLSRMMGVPYMLGEPVLQFTTTECSVATWVTNGDFRDYRRRTQKGSDFYVYSTIEYITTDDRIVV